MKNRESGTRSSRLWREAQELIPGGVNSPVRAFKSVGEEPVFVRKAKGAKVWDCDGRVYIDYIMSWGPLILGHAHSKVVEAVRSAAGRGTSYGLPTQAETELARIIREAFPSVQKVRLVNSGTEAAMTAIRLSRAFANREKILKFDGCYHGHADVLLASAGSGAATFGIPGSAGVSNEIVKNTITVRYNDAEAVKNAISQNRRENGECKIACVIVEPVCGNMGVVLPDKGFLRFLREITRENGIVLIFDEVITGFRVSFGGAQEYYGVDADLTVLGKIIGGGLPVGAFGGKEEIMRLLAPEGPVYQAGTLSGNPISVAAGLATLRLLKNRKIYRKLESLGKSLEDGLLSAARTSGVSATVNRVGSMLSLFFSADPVRNYDDAKKTDAGFFAKYHSEMRKRGILIAPSRFEAMFLSSAHTERDIAKTVAAFRESLQAIS